MALAIILIGGTVSLILFLLALQIFRADKNEYQRNKSRYSHWYDPFLGRAHQNRDGTLDGRVQAGIVRKNKTGEFEANGRLSEASLDRILIS